MSLYDYRQSLYLLDGSFYALIMAAMRKADSDNLPKLQAAFPDVWEELHARYNAGGGCLNDDERDWVLMEIQRQQEDDTVSI